MFPCIRVSLLQGKFFVSQQNLQGTKQYCNSISRWISSDRNSQSEKQTIQQRRKKKMLDPAAEIGLVFIFQSNKQSQRKETVNS